MTTVISLMIALLSPIRSSKWGNPIQTPDTCLSAYTVRVAACRAEYPDSTSLGRAVCEANAAGQYTACIAGIP